MLERGKIAVVLYSFALYTSEPKRGKFVIDLLDLPKVSAEYPSNAHFGNSSDDLQTSISLTTRTSLVCRMTSYTYYIISQSTDYISSTGSECCNSLKQGVLRSLPLASPLYPRMRGFQLLTISTNCIESTELPV